MSQLFPSVVEETVFWLVFVGGFASFFIRIGRAERRSRKTAKKTETNRLSNLNTVGALLAFIAVWPGYARIWPLPHWLFYPGITLMVLGMAISQWAVVVLGSFYAGTVRIMADQKVVDTGPYRLIRHTVYAGLILVALGLGLALQSWAAVILVLVGVSTFGPRIFFEEKFLRAELGEQYVEYCRKTKRLIPFIF